jgi:adenosylcobinamide-GDP ribazoletransferase
VDVFTRAIARLRIATAFLTRLPMRAPDAGPAEVGRSLAYFPIVGIALGLGLALETRLFQGLLPPELVAAILVATLAAVTGALHLDGLADLFDGLGGGRGDRERTLAIMRDGRIGAHGATALVVVLLVKVLALAAVIAAGSDGLRAVAVFPVVSRWLAAILIALFPYAREEGVGRAFVDQAGTSQVAIATLVASAALTWGGLETFVAAAPALAAALVLGVWLTWRLGGLTGDVYGAGVELSETVFLVAAAAIV